MGILHELIQNADDAGASKVAFLLDEGSHGESSLLGPAMRAWQGPALYVYNDATFSPQDFKNICSIGSNSKLASCAATGCAQLPPHHHHPPPPTHPCRALPHPARLEER